MSGIELRCVSLYRDNGGVPFTLLTQNYTDFRPPPKHSRKCGYGQSVSKRMLFYIFITFSSIMVSGFRCQWKCHKRNELITSIIKATSTFFISYTSFNLKSFNVI